MVINKQIQKLYLSSEVILWCPTLVCTSYKISLASGDVDGINTSCLVPYGMDERVGTHLHGEVFLNKWMQLIQ